MKLVNLRLPSVLTSILMATVLMGALSGCKSKQDAAIQQAKQTAASTGQPQQVVATDSNGNMTTTVVQPPVQGQTAQVTTTTVTPKGTAANAATGSAAAQAGQTPAPQPGTVTVGPVPPPPPPPEVRVVAGTSLTIRIDQRISAKGNRAGDKFTGEIVEPVLDGNGQTILPKGVLVGGVVDLAHRRGHFKGAANLELRLTSLTLNGQEMALETADLRTRKKGKGKRSAAFIGGATGLGMLIGGVATGGVGVAIGGAAGAGAGTAVAGLTGNRDLVIPAESIVHFKLAEDLVVQR